MPIIEPSADVNLAAERHEFGVLVQGWENSRKVLTRRLTAILSAIAVGALCTAFVMWHDGMTFGEGSVSAGMVPVLIAGVLLVGFAVTSFPTGWRAVGRKLFCFEGGLIVSTDAGIRQVLPFAGSVVSAFTVVNPDAPQGPTELDLQAVAPDDFMEISDTVVAAAVAVLAPAALQTIRSGGTVHHGPIRLTPEGLVGMIDSSETLYPWPSITEFREVDDLETPRWELVAPDSTTVVCRGYQDVVNYEVFRATLRSLISTGRSPDVHAE